MELLALLGVILIVLGIVHYVPLVLGVVLGLVLIVVGGSPRIGLWRR